MTDINFDRIQDQQDRHSSEWQRQFAIYNEPHEPDLIHDYKGDLITESELWITEDGLVPLSCLVAYCKDAIDKRVSDIDTAIETVKAIGGYEYE
ncbi:hypothetical protein [Ligilactobacillus acidipiscis]|uniref:hypothetical protein n=1 Tax=Ligilactobacillus acidipiscis TaxID=89059 RepID=UPI0009A628A7|nr:hypothetical protein [Ligilactobacillus acidipiscis]